jgi:NADPH:quinone reductase-like Zn-dependent oxidoreductase
VRVEESGQGRHEHVGREGVGDGHPYAADGTQLLARGLGLHREGRRLGLLRVRQQAQGEVRRCEPVRGAIEEPCAELALEGAEPARDGGGIHAQGRCRRGERSTPLNRQQHAQVIPAKHGSPVLAFLQSRLAILRVDQHSCTTHLGGMEVHMTTMTMGTAVTNAKIRFVHYGTPDTLEAVHEQVPEPGAAEVRVRVEASSVQYTDTLIRRRLYPALPARPPLTPGYDLVGVVDAVGEAVERWRVGDRVADLSVIGGNARFAIRPAEGLVAVPRSVDAGRATTLVLSWVTAYQALHRVARAQAGERLLAIGGNGAVGQALIALGVRAGLEVYATASEEYHAALRAAGATPLPREGWQQAVRELGGVDVVVDGVAAGGFGSSYRALRAGGRLVGIGVTAAAASGSLLRSAMDVIGLFARGLWPDGKGATMYSITTMRGKQPAWFAEDLAALFALLESDAIDPRVAERLTLDEVRDAHVRLEAGGLRGKLVLEPWA